MNGAGDVCYLVGCSLYFICIIDDCDTATWTMIAHRLDNSFQCDNDYLAKELLHK